MLEVGGGSGPDPGSVGGGGALGGGTRDPQAMIAEAARRIATAFFIARPRRSNAPDWARAIGKPLSARIHARRRIRPEFQRHAGHLHV
jgi:hypothetical protein